jgi:hypothetical protein
MKPPYIMRMEEELRELNIKTEALAGWINNTEHFKSLTDAEQNDERSQLFHMRGYGVMLESRLRRATAGL